MVSGKYLGAVQRGLIAYDFPNRMTREDQALISGPSVNSSFTSNNMTEWFHNTTWYYMDWTTGVCQTTDFGWGQVRPDFMIASGYPLERGPPTFIDVYTTKEPLRRDFVNVSWIQVDGSAGFGGPPRTSLFEWYLDKDDVPRRMRMPSSLSSDLMVDLSEFTK